MKAQHGVSGPVDVPLMTREAAGSDLLWGSSDLSHAAGPGHTIAACASLGLNFLGMELRERLKDEAHSINHRSGAWWRKLVERVSHWCGWRRTFVVALMACQRKGVWPEWIEMTVVEMMKGSAAGMSLMIRLGSILSVLDSISCA